MILGQGKYQNRYKKIIDYNDFAISRSIHVAKYSAIKKTFSSIQFAVYIFDRVNTLKTVLFSVLF